MELTYEQQFMKRLGASSSYMLLIHHRIRETLENPATDTSGLIKLIARIDSIVVRAFNENQPVLETTRPADRKVMKANADAELAALTDGSPENVAKIKREAKAFSNAVFEQNKKDRDEKLKRMN